MLRQCKHPRQIGIQSRKNATKENQINYMYMKSILDKINRADKVQEQLQLSTMQSLEADIVEMQYGLKKIKELKKEIKATYEKTKAKIDTDLSQYETKSKEVGIEPEKIEAYNKLKELKTEMENVIKS
jgi:succinate dehydrogenase flavin-adding protein (antitoxin of CptAB toxin-antitoxin module)